MKNTKTFTSIFLTALVLSLVIFATNTSPASARTIFLGRGKNLDMKLSPEVPLFDPDEDGFFYPGSPKITKNLEVINVGDVPFRICRINATFYGHEKLAEGLHIKIQELRRYPRLKPHLLYKGTLNDLEEGAEVSGKTAVPRRKGVTLQISVWMPETAGNEYQGLSMTADIAITVWFPPRK